MHQITVGTKNQVVIPLEVRKQLPELKPGRKVSVFLLNSTTVVLKASSRSWLERSFGAFAGKWSNQQLKTKVHQLRNEWRDRI